MRLKIIFISTAFTVLSKQNLFRSVFTYNSSDESVSSKSRTSAVHFYRTFCVSVGSWQTHCASLWVCIKKVIIDAGKKNHLTFNSPRVHAHLDCLHSWASQLKIWSRSAFKSKQNINYWWASPPLRVLQHNSEPLHLSISTVWVSFASAARIDRQSLGPRPRGGKIIEKKWVTDPRRRNLTSAEEPPGSSQSPPSSLLQCCRPANKAVLRGEAVLRDQAG